ncbi:cytochrome P450 [Roseateles sp.]|uniref:cytochrome P450 n=1 Tax=Roseateles sp. TaxID=1971397 RepID=UPI0039E75B90
MTTHIDPYAHYAHMRATTPVHFNPTLKVWEVYGYHDIQTVLGDAKTFSSDLSDGKMMVFMDPPRHTQFRRLVARAFTSKVIADLEPSVQAITDALLDRVEESGGMDLVRDLAFALPVTVIAELLGLPAADHERFKQWSIPAIRAAEMELMGLVPAPELVQAVDELDAYLADLIAARRDCPSADLVSALLAAEVDGERLTLQEVASTCRLLLIAGFETTTNLIGNTCQLLLTHPEALACLYADPELAPAAIEEALRFNTPFQFFARIAKRDVELGGQLIEAGQQVMTFNASGNRDESAFPHADRFDITRTVNRHLSFGHGIHYCLGAGLGRLEARVALTTLLRRFGGLRLDEGRRAEPLASVVLFGFSSLPVRWSKVVAELHVE